MQFNFEYDVFSKRSMYGKGRIWPPKIHFIISKQKYVEN